MKSLLIVYMTLFFSLMLVAVLESCGDNAKRISCDVTADSAQLCTCTAFKSDQSFVSISCQNSLRTDEVIKLNVNLGE